MEYISQQAVSSFYSGHTFYVLMNCTAGQNEPPTSIICISASTYSLATVAPNTFHDCFLVRIGPDMSHRQLDSRKSALSPISFLRVWCTRCLPFSLTNTFEKYCYNDTPMFFTSLQIQCELLSYHVCAQTSAEILLFSPRNLCMASG